MPTDVVKADSKGRVTLGRAFAGHLLMLSQIEPGVVQLTLAEAVPAREAWLRRNKHALESVMNGLQQTGKGEFAEPPNLGKDAALVERIEE